MEGDSEVQASMKSVEDCISVLQGDLHQPGTPAIVLKLAASWQKLHLFLTNYLNSSTGVQIATTEKKQPEPGYTEDALGTITNETSSLVGTDIVPPPPVTRGNEVNGCPMMAVDRPDGVETQPSEVPPESSAGSQDLALEPTEIQCSGLPI